MSTTTSTDKIRIAGVDLAAVITKHNLDSAETVALLTMAMGFALGTYPENRRPEVVMAIRDMLYKEACNAEAFLRRKGSL